MVRLCFITLFIFQHEFYPALLLLALGDDQLTNYCLLLCLLLLSWTYFFRHEENIRVTQSSSLIPVLTAVMQKHVTGDSMKLFALVAAFQHPSCVICMLVHVGWMWLLSQCAFVGGVVLLSVVFFHFHS